MILITVTLTTSHDYEDLEMHQHMGNVKNIDGTKTWQG